MNETSGEGYHEHEVAYWDGKKERMIIRGAFLHQLLASPSRSGVV